MNELKTVPFYSPYGILTRKNNCIKIKLYEMRGAGHMRFIHTADIHLGAVPDKNKGWSETRKKEITDTFERLIYVVKEEAPDVLFIAGDLFHRQPLLRELKEINYLFSKISQTKVVLIAGNHDYIHRESYYRHFEWNENVIFLKSPDIESVYIPDINTEIYGASYYDRENTKAIYDNLTIKNGEHINVLVAHGGDEKHIPINANRLLISGFDYIALGHIHKPGCIGAPDSRAKYCGALEPLDVNDLEEHGYIRGEVTKTVFHTEFVPFAKRKYEILKIEINTDMTALEVLHSISEDIEKNGRDNLYRILITGIKDEIMQIPYEEIEQLGNVVRIEDKSVADYQYEKLIKENGDNLLSRYLKFFLEDHRILSEKEQKALDYGIRALLLGE